MKVVVTDYNLPDLSIEQAYCDAAGYELKGMKTGTEQERIELVRDADAVITQFAPVNAAVIGAMQKSRVIVRYGIGVDNVDLKAAAAKGIPVCNVPDYCIDEVADHALAMILDLTRKITANAVKVRGGSWGLAVPLADIWALKSMTVGVVGFGRIGREVAGRLKAFKCKVLVYDPPVDAAMIRGCRLRARHAGRHLPAERPYYAALPEQRSNQADGQCGVDRHDEAGRDAGKHVARHVGQDRRSGRGPPERKDFGGGVGRDRSGAARSSGRARETGERDYQFPRRLMQYTGRAEAPRQRGQHRWHRVARGAALEHRQWREAGHALRIAIPTTI